MLEALHSISNMGKKKKKGHDIAMVFKRRAIYFKKKKKKESNIVSPVKLSQNTSVLLRQRSTLRLKKKHSVHVCFQESSFPSVT